MSAVNVIWNNGWRLKVLVVICYPTIGERSMVPHMVAAVKYAQVPTYVPTVNMRWAQTIRLINAIDYS